MTYVKDVDTAEFAQEVLFRSYAVPVVVDFWAAWCGPCKVLGPTLERAAEQYEGAFELVKVDTDRNQQLAGEFKVQGIPTVIGFRNGEPVARFTGALPEPQVRQWIDDLLPGEADLLVDRARDKALEGDSLAAEELYRAALAATADHIEAGTGLAALLIARGEIDEALDVLRRLPPGGEVDKLMAAARVAASRGSDIPALEAKLDAAPDNDRLRIDLAQALAAGGEFEPALDHLLRVVRNRGPLKDDGRKAMLDIFELLGNEHPLTTTYRRNLASALY